MASRSALIGLASITSGAFAPFGWNSLATALGMKLKVTASSRPRVASRRLAIGTRRCCGVIAGCGNADSFGSETTGMLS